MARAGAAALSLCGEGEPVPHPHEEAEGPGGSTRPLLRQRAATRSASRTNPLSTPAAMAGESRTVRDLSASIASRLSPYGGIPGDELVRRARVRTVAPLQRGALSS